MTRVLLNRFILGKSKKINWKDKVALTARLQSKKTGILVAHQQKVSFVWLVATISLGVYALGVRSSLLKFPRYYADNMYLYGSSSFLIGFFFAILGFVSAKSPEKRSLAQILVMVDFIAMVSYSLLAFRLTPSFKDVVGYPVDVARYMEWICTCPSLIALIANVTRDKEKGTRTIMNDVALLTTGFLGAILREPFSQMALILSMGTHCVVVSGLWDMYTAAIEGKTDCKLDKLSLKLARVATMLAWNAFPTIFFLVRYKMISFALGESLIVCADIIAKVFLTLILINASVEESQNEKVDVLTGIAAEMEAEMGNTEKLLNRMMPAEVIEQIKSGQATEAQEYENVTVFFSDIANFTVLSSKTAVF